MHNLKIAVGPLHLVLNDRALQNLLDKRQRYPYLPRPESILTELGVLNQGGIPATIRQYDGKEQLLLYTPSYYLALYPSLRGDGYLIAYLDSLNLREHKRLTEGVLRIQALGWHLHRELTAIPAGSNNYRSNIWHSWQTLELQKQQGASQHQQEAITHVH